MAQGLRTRCRLAALAALLVMGACQPQQPPNTAAPTTVAPAGIALPEGARHYDAAVVPVDETRTVRSVAPPASPPSQPRQLSDRERRAIAAWDEEAAAKGWVLTVRPPPRGATGTLPMPSVDEAALPRPDGQRRPPRLTGTGRELGPLTAAKEVPAASSPPRAKAEPPRPVARIEPVPTAAPPPPPAPPSPVPAPQPAPVEQAAPVQAAAAAPVEAARLPPAGTPLTTVIFTARSANLSDGARIALGFFAQDPKMQRLRRIELWASSSADDPVDAGKIALARVLAVHAFLIDQGFKPTIEIGGYFEAHGLSPDRVDVLVR